MKHLFTVFLLLASPVAAQDQPDHALNMAQITQGIAACMATKGDIPGLTSTLGAKGWNGSPDSYGTMIFIPSDGDATMVMCATDTALCRVESSDIGTTEAATLLAQALPDAAAQDPDANGCPRFKTADGTMVTLMSGDDTTECTADRTSALLFDFANQP